MITNIEQTIREYLPELLHLSLATCVDNKPRVCEVHYVYDQDLHLYFRSKPSRRHSQEIAHNPYIAGNIVQQHASEDKPRAVYFAGICHRLDRVENSSPIYQLFRDRFGKGEEIITEQSQEDGHQFYQISVSEFALFDKRESDPGQKYSLLRNH